MNTIQTVLSISQILIGGIVVLLLLAGCAVALMAWADSILRRHFEAGRGAEFSSQRARLREVSNWFSEDVATMELLQDLAKDGLGNNTSYVRERWRERRAKESK